MNSRFRKANPVNPLEIGVIGSEKSSDVIYSLYKGYSLFRAAVICNFFGKFIGVLL